MTTRVVVDSQEVELLECPSCGVQVALMGRNCGVFRCARRKDGGEVAPHATRAELEGMLARGEIWGCGKPFRLIGERAEACDYI